MPLDERDRGDARTLFASRMAEAGVPQVEPMEKGDRIAYWAWSAQSFCARDALADGLADLLSKPILDARSSVDNCHAVAKLVICRRPRHCGAGGSGTPAGIFYVSGGIPSFDELHLCLR